VVEAAERDAMALLQDEAAELAEPHASLAKTQATMRSRHVIVGRRMANRYGHRSLG
jgi:hypothetical protein